MFYAINGKNFSASLATADGIVVQASGKVVWMCGQRIERVVGWATHHQLRWTVSAEPPPDVVLYAGPPLHGAEQRLTGAYPAAPYP